LAKLQQKIVSYFGVKPDGMTLFQKTPMGKSRADEQTLMDLLHPSLPSCHDPTTCPLKLSGGAAQSKTYAVIPKPVAPSGSHAAASIQTRALLLGADSSG